MKNTTLLLIAMLAFSHDFFAQVIYVKTDGTGNGTSWQDATNSLQKALARAVAGTEIWVAEGTYFPIDCDYCNVLARSESFFIPEGVAVYGGFVGTESSVSQRKWFAHPSKLSGNIGEAGESDNSFTVVSFKNASESTILDGFVVTAGRADGWEPIGSPARSGGGIFNDGAGEGNRSNPTIRNCVFLENYAEEGGALFNHGNGGEASPKLENCTFVSNRAGKGGGAIFQNNDKGTGRLDLKKCKFVNNESGFGAAIFLTQSAGSGRNQVTSCHFVNNKAAAGSAFFSLALGEYYVPEFFLCDFLNNQSKEGEEVFHCPEAQVPQRLLNSLALNVSTKM